MKKTLITSLLIAFSVFYFVPAIYAQSMDFQARLSQFLTGGGSLEMGKEKRDSDYGQIYYEFEGNKKFITSSNYTNGEVYAVNGYVTWMSQIEGYWQIFLHNVYADTTIQLTKVGNNTNPKVSSSGKVVWEGWVEENWQLFLFDGTKIRQITQGDLSINPYIEGDYIVYARKNSDGLWRSSAYSIQEDKHIDIDIGNETEFPKLVNGDIYVGPPIESQKRYPLKVQDLFLFGLNSDTSSLPEPSPMLEEEVLETESVFEVSVTPTEATGSPAVLN